MPRYEASPDLLKDRVILITGAADGIGRALALSCAEHGATTVLLDKNVGNLESLYDEIEKKGYPQPALYPLDLEGASPDDYLTMAESIDKQLGRLDAIVHNAALMGTITPMHLYKTDAWFKVMQVNINAPFLINQACIPMLNEADDARILFVGDACGQHGSAYWGPYGVSKSGLENMMQILADELEHTSIKINSIDPGIVRTRMRAFAYPAEDPNLHPLPETIMPAFLYLLGSDSKKYSGQAFMAEDFLG